jgi:hypothetical protein
MEDDPVRLRLAAEMCRQFIARISEPETVRRLTALAEHCEQRLQLLKKQDENTQH